MEKSEIVVVASQSFVASPKQFKSGSTGWFASGKLVYPKSDAITVSVGRTVLSGAWRTFKTGNVGYFVSGKATVQGVAVQVTCTAAACKGDVNRLQVTMSLVVVGSKPKDPSRKPARKSATKAELSAELAALKAQLAALKAK